MADAVRLPREEVCRDGAVIGNGAGFFFDAEILVVTAPAHPEALRIFSAPAEAKAVLEERRASGISVDFAPRAPIPICRFL